MGDAALQAALARAARAPDDPETWRALTRAVRPLGNRWDDLRRVATALAPFRGGERLERWWRGVLRGAGWVAGEPSPDQPAGPFRCWALAPDGAHAAAAAAGGVALWRGAGLEDSAMLPLPHGGEVVALGFDQEELVALVEGRQRALLRRCGETWRGLWEGPPRGRVLALDPQRLRFVWAEAGRAQLDGPGLPAPVVLADAPDHVHRAAALAPGGDAAALLRAPGQGTAGYQVPLQLECVRLPDGALAGSAELSWIRAASLAFSPDGRTLAVAGGPEAPGRQLQLYRVGPGGLGEESVHRTPLSRGVVPGPGDEEVTILGQAASRWSFSGGFAGATPGLEAEAIAVAPATKRVLLAREAGFALASSEPGTLVTPGPGGALLEAGFEAQGTRLWTCDDRQVLCTWEWPGGHLVRARPLWRSHALPWGGGGATGTFVTIFHETLDRETGAAITRRYHPEDRQLVENWRLADVSPDGATLLLASDTRLLRALDAHAGRSRWRRRLRGAEFGPVAYRPGGETILAVIRNPGRVYELAASDGVVLREWALPPDLGWGDPRWRLRLGGPAPLLVGPGAVRLEVDDAVTVLLGPGEGPCAVARGGGRRARWEGGRVRVTEAGGGGVADVPVEAPPRVLLLSPEGDALLWSSGAALRHEPLP